MGSVVRWHTEDDSSRPRRAPHRFPLTETQSEKTPCFSYVYGWRKRDYGLLKRKTVHEKMARWANAQANGTAGDVALPKDVVTKMRSSRMELHRYARRLPTLLRWDVGIAAS